MNSNPINICVYNAAGKANFVIDDNGWFGGPTAAMGEQFYATSPTRICDTRTGMGTPCAGHELTPGGDLTVAAAGPLMLPTNAKAMVATLAAVAGSSFTFISASSSKPATPPNVSVPNVCPGQ